MRKFLMIAPPGWYTPGENQMVFFSTSFSNDGKNWFGVVVEIHNRYEDGTARVEILSRDEADITFLFDDSEGEAKLNYPYGTDRTLKYKLGRVGVDPLLNEERQLIGFMIVFEVVDVKTNEVVGVYGVPYLKDKEGRIWSFSPNGLGHRGQTLVKIVP